MSDPYSPCNNVCCLDGENVCLSCGRTLAEISSWSQMSDEEKREVLDRIDSSD